MNVSKKEALKKGISQKEIVGRLEQQLKEKEFYNLREAIDQDRKTIQNHISSI